MLQLNTSPTLPCIVVLPDLQCIGQDWQIAGTWSGLANCFLGGAMVLLKHLSALHVSQPVLTTGLATDWGRLELLCVIYMQ